jgi:flagellar biosynthesis protein FlhG
MIMHTQQLLTPETTHVPRSGSITLEEVGPVARPVDSSQPADQAAQLRRLVQQTAKHARVLAVTSGKGGVGKTNVAANLALCLAAAGKSVILLDADLGLANLDILLPVQSHLNLSHVISGRKSLRDVIQTGPAGVKLICGASGLTAMENLSDQQRQLLLSQMASLEHDADFIIVDTAAGISHNVLAFCKAADYTLVVTTPDPAAITDAYAVVKTLAYAEATTRLSLLVNCADDRDQAKNLYRKIATIATRFLDVNLYDAGFILRDPHLLQAVRKRRPVVLASPRSPAAAGFLILAQKVARTQNPPQPENHAFFHRVLNWLAKP